MDDDRARVAALIAQQPASPTDRDVVMGSLRRLCAAAAQALSASGAAVAVMVEDGTGVVVASDSVSERVEELQFMLGEGPGIDAFTGRRPVLVPDLAAEAMARWPVYTPAAHDLGIRAAFAFPIQVGAARLGILNVFRARPGQLSGDQLRHALIFAEVALTTLLDGQHNAASGAAADGLADAVERRAELFQAQGMVMVQLGVSLAEALTRMRAYAYAEGRQLGEVAADIIARRLRFDPNPDQHGPHMGQGLPPAPS